MKKITKMKEGHSIKKYSEVLFSCLINVFYIGDLNFEDTNRELYHYYFDGGLLFWDWTEFHLIVLLYYKTRMAVINFLSSLFLNVSQFWI